MTKKIIKIIGGLGNQMFQYAFALALSKRFKAEIILDLSWFEDVKKQDNVTNRELNLNIFNAPYKIAQEQDLTQVIQTEYKSKIHKLIWKLTKIRAFQAIGNLYRQKNAFFFDKSLFHEDKYLYFEGFFQNEKYFSDIRDNILNSFSLKEQPDKKNIKLIETIKSTNSISIHVRRGDYVTLKCANTFHGLCSIDYYQNAINYIAQKIPNPHFFLFSDDIKWVVENLKIDYPYTIIDFNKEKDYLDLELMKNCKHNIIANSSFSWWGAWLNQNPDKIIIAPKKWTAKKVKCDIAPKKWIKL